MVVRCARLAPSVLLWLVSVVGCTHSGPRRASLTPAPPDRATAGRLNGEGLALVERSEFAQAEPKFRSALEADPWLGAAHANLGVTLLQLGKYYEAAWELQYASQLMPHASAPRTNLGILFEQTGRYTDAESQLRDALALDPEDVEIIGQLARIHVRQNKFTPETKSWIEKIASSDDQPQWRDWARTELLRAPNRTLRPVFSSRPMRSSS